MQLIKKFQQGLQIFKLTKYKYYKAAQLADKDVTYCINGKPLMIQGSFILTMVLEIVAKDVYHLKHQKNPKVIFDVGANVGVFSLHAATLFPDCDVYAFEPSVENFELLVKNTKRFSHIHCLNMAVSNYNGRSYLSGYADNTAFKTSAVAIDNVLQECETITLQTFLKEHAIQHIDVLKLDCEGAEYDIAETDLSCIHNIVGEYHTVESKTTEYLKNCFSKQNFIIKQWIGAPANISGLFWAANKRYNA